NHRPGHGHHDVVRRRRVRVRRVGDAHDRRRRARHQRGQHQDPPATGVPVGGRRVEARPAAYRLHAGSPLLADQTGLDQYVEGQGRRVGEAPGRRRRARLADQRPNGWQAARSGTLAAMQRDDTIHLGEHRVGSAHRPYVIAEMSGNHNQSLDKALELVEAAAAAGAHAIKLQTYTADTMTLPVRGPGFVIENPASLWHGRTLYDLYQEAHTPWEWHRPIFDLSRRLGIDCFSSP